MRETQRPPGAWLKQHGVVPPAGSFEGLDLDIPQGQDGKTGWNGTTPPPPVQGGGGQPGRVEARSGGSNGSAGSSDGAEGERQGPKPRRSRVVAGPGDSAPAQDGQAADGQTSVMPAAASSSNGDGPAAPAEAPRRRRVRSGAGTDSGAS
jgi:hypothetical protein